MNFPLPAAATRFLPFGRNRRRKWIDVNRLLLGGESGMSAERYARLSGDLLRPSRRIADSPHAKLLQTYLASGDAVFDPRNFECTDYYKNALFNIEVFGHYFDARAPSDVVHGARRFAQCFTSAPSSNGTLQWGQSVPGTLPIVRPISNSKCYQIVDGHHRCAIAYVRGTPRIEVEIKLSPVQTPLQSALLDVLWLKGRKELYQPVSFPELEDEWIVTRQCQDRLAKMVHFLRSTLSIRGKTTYMDLASSYGWFVAQMKSHGFTSYGVERDPFAIRVGQIAYGLGSTDVTRSDCVSFLRTTNERAEIVSCFSLLHHFVLGNGQCSAEEFIRLLDRYVGRVLFFEMGQEDEDWYRDRLAGWSVDFIEEWLQRHTRFRRIIRLGRDKDGRGRFKGNFGRMLFACIR